MSILAAAGSSRPEEHAICKPPICSPTTDAEANSWPRTGRIISKEQALRRVIFTMFVTLSFEKRKEKMGVWSFGLRRTTGREIREGNLWRRENQATLICRSRRSASALGLSAARP